MNLEIITIPLIINTIGLTFDIIGAIILFFYGPPQPNLEEGIALGAEDYTPLPSGKTVKEHNEEIRNLRKKFISISRFAMILIIIGFALQLLANWL
jgi:hypothetical protein